MSEVLPDAVHSGEVCGASVSEMMKGHLPDDQAENVFEDGGDVEDIHQASLTHPLITISDRVFVNSQQLSAVKTTISNPEQLSEDAAKYHEGRANTACDCQTCRARIAAYNQQRQAAPIMITPYRHNWLISGGHKDSTDDSDFLDFRTCCQIQ